MKLQVFSDLHLEQLGTAARGAIPTAQSDVLVLAGDIHTGVKGIELLADYSIPVIYVFGTYELLGHQLEALHSRAGVVASRTSAHVLENRAVIIQGVRFLGATLWTDFQLGPGRESEKRAASATLPEFQFIHFNQQRRFSVQDAVTRHWASRNWLASELAHPFAGPTVVVSHHAPSAESLAPSARSQLLASAQASDVQELKGCAELWIHGRTRRSADYRWGSTRVVSNPRGLQRPAYRNRVRRFENERFNPVFELDV